MPASNTKRLPQFLGVAFVAALLIVFLAGTRYEPPGFRDLRWDEQVDDERNISTNLSHDIKLMWKTVDLATLDHKIIQVSPVSAINAADRVFSTVDLIGNTTNEVFALLGHNLKTKSVYKHGFWPVKTNQIVYCFECGNFGWQFNLTCDPSGRVTQVERRWIH